MLVGDGKVLPKGTVIEELEYLPNELIQDIHHDHDGKEILVDILIKTSKGIYIIEM